MHPTVRMRATALLAGFAMLASAAIGFAQSRPQQSPSLALASACKADIETFCPDMKPGGGRIATCLRDHASEISKACRDAALAARAARQGQPAAQ